MVQKPRRSHRPPGVPTGLPAPVSECLCLRRAGGGVTCMLATPGYMNGGVAERLCMKLTGFTLYALSGESVAVYHLTTRPPRWTLYTREDSLCDTRVGEAIAPSAGYANERVWQAWLICKMMQP
jgi:hypothetical protein